VTVAHSPFCLVRIRSANVGGEITLTDIGCIDTCCVSWTSSLLPESRNSESASAVVVSTLLLRASTTDLRLSICDFMLIIVCVSDTMSTSEGEKDGTRLALTAANVGFGTFVA